MASKMWSFFPIIHSIDLNPYLNLIIAKNIIMINNKLTIIKDDYTEKFVSDIGKKHEFVRQMIIKMKIRE